MSDRPTKTFCCHYFHDGCQWGLNIEAYDWADAEARVKKLGYLMLDGELMMTIPAGSGKRHWLPRMICWIKNVLSLALKGKR